MTTSTAGNGYAAVPQDLPTIERMCEQLYTAADPTVRSQAESALLSLSSNPRHLSQCTMILDNSKTAYAQKFAAWCLTKLITTFWTQIGTEERVQLRNYVLSYLANNGPSLAQFVRLELSTLVCRVTKLGWVEDDTHKSIVEDISRFLDASEEHCHIGLTVLARLVSDMNIYVVSGRRWITQSQSRKTSISFRDSNLLKIFNISLRMLAKFLNSPAHSKLRGCALQLSIACLTFDFVGCAMDESSEDLGTLHPPSAWKSVVEDPDTVKIFLELYRTHCNSDASQSAKALECLVQLVSMRRTLFSNDENRTMNIRRHMQGAIDILSNNAGLSDHDNYHQFCRWLSRMKVNYQLDEIISLDIYRQWIERVFDFTMTSLAAEWSWVGDSLYYLLSLWARLIGSIPYLKSGKQVYLENYVPKIVEQYVTTRLNALSQITDEDDDDDVKEHLEIIPSIFRFEYEKTANLMVGLFDPRLENYKVFAASGGIGANPADVSKVEREMAWLTRIVGSVVSGRLNVSSAETQELTDGEVSARVFQVMIQTVAADNNAHQRAGGAVAALGTPAARARNTKGAVALDAAIVDFTHSFRRSYIGEDAVATSKVYVRMAERLGMTDHMIVLNVIASKIANNLRNYGVVDGPQIISKSLSLLQDLASGYSSSRLLCKLTTIQEMVANHDEDNFPFMKGPDTRMGRHRTTFYQTLLRILFASSGSNFDSELEFTRFLEPIRRKLEALAALPNKQSFLSDPSVKAAAIGVLRDLRGVVNTVLNRRTYVLFFDWIYPTHTPVLLKICEVFAEAGVPDVSNVLLKFYSEFAFNKSQRIVFDSSSPNGILLFREVSKILVTYGSHTLTNIERIGGSAGLAKASGNAYQMFYKGVWVCLLAFTHALSGNYVNFGVFALYGDPALKDAMNICFRLMRAVPIDQVLAFPKVAKAHFGLLEILATNHGKEIAELDHSTFRHIMESLREGLQCHEIWMSSQSSVAIDNICAFRFKQNQKGGDHAHLMEEHVKQSPDLFPSCLEAIFNMITVVECSNQWSLSRPLLSLILTNSDTYEKIKNKLIMAQPQERHMAINVAFQKLMHDIRPNLESKNRDTFTQHLTQFRTALKTEGVSERLT